MICLTKLLVLVVILVNHLVKYLVNQKTTSLELQIVQKPITPLDIFIKIDWCKIKLRQSDTNIYKSTEYFFG